MRWLGAAVTLAFLMAGACVADAAADASDKGNSNWLLKEYGASVILRTSSSYSGWPAQRMIDGNPQTSWFSAGQDSTALGKSPWIEIEFPSDEKVRRITQLGNREPSWRVGYSITLVRFELLDKSDKVLKSWVGESTNATHDIEYSPKAPIAHVRKIRITSLQDQGKLNSYGDVAIGEIEIE